MKGIELRDILKQMGVSLPALAKAMGYKAEENLYSKLRSEDIKTTFLEEIAKATNKNISYFYQGSHDAKQSIKDTETNCCDAIVSNVVSQMSELVKSNSELVRSNYELVRTNSELVKAVLEKKQTSLKNN